MQTSSIVKKQDFVASKVNSSIDGVVQQLQSSTVNGHGQPQSRPGRLELEDDAASTQNCVSASSAADLVVAAASSNTVSQLQSSKVAAGAGKDSHAAKTTAACGNRPQCGSGNSATEINGNAQSSSLDAVIVSGVPLPSPPITPPTVKSLQCDGGHIVLPSPARSYRSPRQDSRKNSTPDSVELPPPPSPPLQFCQSSSLDSPGGVLPPPPLDDSLYVIPPRVSPPPPMSPVSSAVANIMTSTTPSKSVACSNEVSTFLVEQATSLVDGLSALSDRMSGFEGEMQDGGESASNDQPLVRDTRSDLLAAIREGTSDSKKMRVQFHQLNLRKPIDWK